MFALCRRRFPDILKTLGKQPLEKTYSNICYRHSLPPLIPNIQCHYQPLRHKSKKTSKQPSRAESTTATEETSAWDDQIVDKNTKIMNVTVKSTRIDGLLKSGLGIARNKIETMFYESKIRVNGEKLLKKSDLAKEGDEIDVIKGPSATNPQFLNVARVEVLTIYEKGDNLSVKLRRCKNLTIDKYDNEQDK